MGNRPVGERYTMNLNNTVWSDPPGCTPGCFSLPPQRSKCLDWIWNLCHFSVIL